MGPLTMIQVDKISGQPLTPLDCLHHHPYEHLLILGHSQDSSPGTREHHVGVIATREDNKGGKGGLVPPSHVLDVLPPDGFTLFSTPREHSRKPPAPLLAELLSRVINPAGDSGPAEVGRGVAGSRPPLGPCLEMFGRELFPGWTSWGNEVLRFKHLELNP